MTRYRFDVCSSRFTLQLGVVLKRSNSEVEYNTPIAMLVHIVQYNWTTGCRWIQSQYGVGCRIFLTITLFCDHLETQSLKGFVVLAL